MGTNERTIALIALELTVIARHPRALVVPSPTAPPSAPVRSHFLTDLLKCARLVEATQSLNLSLNISKAAALWLQGGGRSIGGGISGVTTSYFLAKRGVASLVIDPVGIAPAASGKAGGFLALDWNDGAPVGPLARRSFAPHESIAKELGEAKLALKVS